MNFCIYWFFAIYHIYKRFSWDKDFVLFAVGLFTFIQGFLLTGVTDLVFTFLKYPSPLHNNNYILPFIGGVLFFTNGFLFIPRQKQTEFYEKYKETRSTLKDTIVIIASILSVVLFFIAMVQVRSNYTG